MFQVYVDIDGTVLHFARSGCSEYAPRVGGQVLAEESDAFFRAICKDGFRPAWLSSGWTQHGRSSGVRDRLWPVLPRCVKRMRTPRFEACKTEAIKPEAPWIWFEDEDYSDRLLAPREGRWLADVGANVWHIEQTSARQYRRRTGLLNPFNHGLLVVLPGTRDNLAIALGELRLWVDHVADLMAWRARVAPYAEGFGSEIGPEMEIREPFLPAKGSLTTRVLTEPVRRAA